MRFIFSFLICCLVLGPPLSQATAACDREISAAQSSEADAASVISPQWAAVRRQRRLLVVGSREWILDRVRNSTLTYQTFATILSKSESAFRRNLNGVAFTDEEVKALVPYLINPDNIIPDEDFYTFGEWLRYHIVNNPFGWTNAEVASRADFNRKNLPALLSGAKGAGPKTIEKFARALNASIEEAFASARLLFGPIRFGGWLEKEMSDRNLKGRPFARRVGISATELRDIVKGRKVPRRKTAKWIAYALRMNETFVLRKAGYLPERSLFGRFVQRHLNAHNLTPRTAAFRLEMTEPRVQELLEGAEPFFHEAERIGEMFHDLPGAFAAAGWNTTTSQFLEWFWKYFKSEPNTQLLAEATGIPPGIVQALSDGSILPARGTLERLIFYWEAPEEEAYSAAGLLLPIPYPDWETSKAA